MKDLLIQVACPGRFKQVSPAPHPWPPRAHSLTSTHVPVLERVHPGLQTHKNEPSVLKHLIKILIRKYNTSIYIVFTRISSESSKIKKKPSLASQLDILMQTY